MRSAGVKSDLPPSGISGESIAQRAALRALSPFRRSCRGRAPPRVTDVELEGAGEGMDVTVGSEGALGDV